MQKIHTMEKTMKQRLTAFVDPVFVTRAKIRGALEGLTMSEIVERALDEYAPKIITDEYSHINLQFDKKSIPKKLLPSVALLGKKVVSKHSKSLNVPR